MGKLADKYRVNEELWSLCNNGLCGFFVKRKVMKQLIKKITKFEADINSILEENIDDIYTYSWTLHNITDSNNEIIKQKIIHYISNENKENRLKIFKAKTPERMDEVFDCDYETADEIAKELNYEEQSDVAED